MSDTISFEMKKYFREILELNWDKSEGFGCCRLLNIVYYFLRLSYFIVSYTNIIANTIDNLYIDSILYRIPRRSMRPIRNDSVTFRPSKT